MRVSDFLNKARRVHKYTSKRPDGKGGWIYDYSGHTTKASAIRAALVRDAAIHMADWNHKAWLQEQGTPHPDAIDPELGVIEYKPTEGHYAIETVMHEFHSPESRRLVIDYYHKLTDRGRGTLIKEVEKEAARHLRVLQMGPPRSRKSMTTVADLLSKAKKGERKAGAKYESRTPKAGGGYKYSYAREKAAAIVAGTYSEEMDRRLAELEKQAAARELAEAAARREADVGRFDRSAERKNKRNAKKLPMFADAGILDQVVPTATAASQKDLIVGGWEDTKRRLARLDAIHAAQAEAYRSIVGQADPAGQPARDAFMARNQHGSTFAADYWHNQAKKLGLHDLIKEIEEEIRDPNEKPPDPTDTPTFGDARAVKRYQTRGKGRSIGRVPRPRTKKSQPNVSDFLSKARQANPVGRRFHKYTSRRFVNGEWVYTYPTEAAHGRRSAAGEAAKTRRGMPALADEPFKLSGQEVNTMLAHLAEGIADQPSQITRVRSWDVGHIKAGICSNIAAAMMTGPEASWKPDAAAFWEDHVREDKWAERPYMASALMTECTNTLVKTWAETSADTHPLAVALQELTVEEFGLEGASLDHFSEEGRQQAQAIKDKHGPFLRRFLRGQYTHTQKWLAARGVKHLTLYRGVRIAKGDPAWTSYSKPGRVDRALQPASSFTVASEAADFFAQGGHNPDRSQEGMVVMVRVPAERVLATCRSGVGCVPEAEVVVLGGEVPAWACHVANGDLTGSAMRAGVYE
jgi:hypothetical protein